MLGLSPANNNKKDERRSGGGASECEFRISPEEFPEFADEGNLLDSIIDLDDLFGDSLLPELEMVDPEILTSDFSDHMNASSTVTTEKESEKAASSSEVVSKREDASFSSSSAHRAAKKRKHNSNQGKRKVKVDWTPELHRRFVEAVEKLGVEKAVPSRILELMNIDCLTRHNVASHLQKYRSHRKHMMAREAEAANWTRKRHTYAPTMGYPKPLHVWGHPTNVMPQYAIPHSPFWPSSDPPPYWHRVHSGTLTTPGYYLPRHCTVYKQPDPGFGPPLDLHPTKERVDAAIGEVLRKSLPLPLPLGLKAPSVDSVMEELLRHGVSHVPPHHFS